MRSGTLFHRVTIQRPTDGGEDEYGSPIPGVPLVLTRTHAEVTPLTGREFFDAQQVQGEVTRRVCVRWQPELTDLRPKDQILFQGRVLDIEYIANLDERKRELELLCREQV